MQDWNDAEKLSGWWEPYAAATALSYRKQSFMISLSCLEAATNHGDSTGNLLRNRACRKICTSGALVDYAERPIIDHSPMSSRVKRHQHVKCRLPRIRRSSRSDSYDNSCGGPCL